MVKKSLFLTVHLSGTIDDMGYTDHCAAHGVPQWQVPVNELTNQNERLAARIEALERHQNVPRTRSNGHRRPNIPRDIASSIAVNILYIFCESF